MAVPSVSGSFVLGITGVSWELLSRYATGGELTNIERLLASGASGPLDLLKPGTGPMAWTSMVTGARPDKHQIYGPKRVDSAYRQRSVTSHDRELPPAWEFVSPAFVANVPVTYPARALEGTLVAGPPFSDDPKLLTHPRSFAAELDATIPDYSFSTPLNRAELAEHYQSCRLIMHRFMHASAGWSLQWIVLSIPARIREIDASDAIELLSPLDELVGELITYVNRQHANLFIVSAPTVYSPTQGNPVEECLVEGGYTPPTDTRKPSRLDRLVNRFLGRPSPMTDTTAFAVGDNVFVNDTTRFRGGSVAPADVPSVKADLTRYLSRNSPHQVYDSDRPSEPDNHKPDLVVTSPAADLLYPSRPHNEIDPRGVYVAYGPNIREGHINNPTVLDVVPTLLHSQLRAIPSFVDGQVLDIFSPSSTVAAQSPTVASSQSD